MPLHLIAFPVLKYANFYFQMLTLKPVIRPSLLFVFHTSRLSERNSFGSTIKIYAETDHFFSPLVVLLP